MTVINRNTLFWSNCLRSKYKCGSKNKHNFLIFLAGHLPPQELSVHWCIEKLIIQETMYVYLCVHVWVYAFVIGNGVWICMYLCVYVCMHIISQHVCMLSFLHPNAGGSSVSEMDLKYNDVILERGIMLCFSIQIKSTFSLSRHNFY